MGSSVREVPYNTDVDVGDENSHDFSEMDDHVDSDTWCGVVASSPVTASGGGDAEALFALTPTSTVHRILVARIQPPNDPLFFVVCRSMLVIQRNSSNQCIYT